MAGSKAMPDGTCFREFIIMLIRIVGGWRQAGLELLIEGVRRPTSPDSSDVEEYLLTHLGLKASH